MQRLVQSLVDDVFQHKWRWIIPVLVVLAILGVLVLLAQKASFRRRSSRHTEKRFAGARRRECQILCVRLFWSTHFMLAVASEMILMEDGELIPSPSSSQAQPVPSQW